MEALGDSLNRWMFDPTVGKLITATVGLLVIVTLVRLGQKSLGRYVGGAEARYRLRKSVTFLGYPIAFIGSGR